MDTNLHLLQTEPPISRLPERVSPRIREWSDQWLMNRSRDELSEQLKLAKECLLHVSEMKQLTARLIWELRIERTQAELKRRAVTRKQ